MDLEFRGSRALVTAVSAGIGLAVAEALAREGCDLVIAARDAAKFGQMAETSKLADAVAILASPRPAYVSGTILTVDGGATYRN